MSGEHRIAAPEFSEAALADKFAETYVESFRYVSEWRRWLQWDGTRWRREKTVLAYDLARKQCVSVASGCNKPNESKALASQKTVAAVEKLARADRRLAATDDQWDADPWLLNTSDGVINLRNGKTREHRPSDYLTKITGTHADYECPTPIWQRFLNRVFDSDKSLIGFMQRVVGYSLTGSTSEHALFFLYGTGANGKSVFLNTISGVLGDYHKTAPIETFTASNVERHPTDVAGLVGARLVTATETEEGRRWAEARVKALTGGDPISARFMRQDFFEFTPHFKLVIAGNHKPGLRSVDEAIRRRFHLVPFTVTIPMAERDKDFAAKLKAEWPGILAWAVEGCLTWQTTGLAAPATVRDATADYLDSQDALGTWIEDCCVRDPQAFQSTGDLFSSYRSWAEKAGEHVGGEKGFRQKLQERGFNPLRTELARGFTGLAIRDKGPWR
ncbi:MAG: phage/plasmid primase, P4 family [Methyloceanibacter sp.]